jgi:hypothetical protein
MVLNRIKIVQKRNWKHLSVYLVGMIPCGALIVGHSKQKMIRDMCVSVGIKKTKNDAGDLHKLCANIRLEVKRIILTIFQ